MVNTGIKIGMIVLHPQKPEWGPGKVLAIAGPHVTVYFRDAGGNTVGERIKKLDMSRVSLEVAPEQSDVWLDHLPLDQKGQPYAHRRLVSFAQARASFLRSFAAAFEDPQYLREERDYKWRAHEHWKHTLGDGQAETLLAADNIEEIRRRALSVAGKTNLLYPVESAAMRDSLQSSDGARAFFTALIPLVAAPKPEQTLFEALITAAQELPFESDRSSPFKWTVTTILPFLARPDVFLFLKPAATKEAAEMLNFELMYDPTPNWRTYSLLLRLGELLKRQLDDLHPRDWIDVQSFMWRVHRA